VKRRKGKRTRDSGATAAPDDMEVDTTATEGARDVMMVEVTRMRPYLAYMTNKELPDNQVEARRIASATL
jgi:hypothetical protein